MESSLSKSLRLRTKRVFRDFFTLIKQREYSDDLCNAGNLFFWTTTHLALIEVESPQL